MLIFQYQQVGEPRHALSFYSVLRPRFYNKNNPAADNFTPALPVHAKHQVQQRGLVVIPSVLSADGVTCPHSLSQPTGSVHHGNGTRGWMFLVYTE